MSDPDDTRLGAAMNDSRVDMGLRWSEVARRAGMSPQNLLRIRKGEIAVTELSARSIERVFDWPQGRVKALLDDSGSPLPDPESFDPATAPVEDLAKIIAAMLDSGNYSDEQVARAIVRARELRSSNSTHERRTN